MLRFANRRGKPVGENAMLSMSTVRPADLATWWPIVSAALPPVVLVCAWATAGALQPPTYRPAEQTISVLAGASASDRWVMTSGLLAVGGCYVLIAFALTALWSVARLLLVVAGLAGIGLAASPVPAHGLTMRHLAFTVIGAAVITMWPIFARLRMSPHALVMSSGVTTAATLLFVALLGWTICETQVGDHLGVSERLSTAIPLCWPLVVTLALRRPVHAAVAASDSRARTPAWLAFARSTSDGNGTSAS
jgi:hypothetical membrane protein